MKKRRKPDIAPNHFPAQKIAALVLCIAGSLHALRVIVNWRLTIDNFVVPTWISVAVAIIAIGVGARLIRGEVRN